ncbi:hypothetical protein DYB32_003977, partial [Aphanomyces invadans]
MDLATKRLRKEYVALKKTPVDNIEAVPLENNILEWHYVIRGVGLYEGGFYHGKLKFPREYPMKPPSVYMITPSGRFEMNTRLCLSISDFHPETWNPLWSVGSILIGLFSFMNEDTATTGSIESSDEDKQTLAASSLATNCTNSRTNLLQIELLSLHQEAANLARQLENLQAHRAACLDGLTDTEMKWEKIARNQLQLKLKAIRENHDLRTALADQSKLQQALEDVLLKKPRVM